ncbi:MAG: histidine kinase, partial [Nakamurella sp.]
WLRTHHWLPDAALAIVLAVLLIPASVPLVLDSSASTPVRTALTVAIVVAQLTVAFRRSQPAIAYLSCSAAMAVLVVAPPLTGLELAGFADPVPAILLPSSGVYLVLLYSVAAHGVGRMPVIALLIAGVGVVLTSARLLSAQIISTVKPTGWPVPLIVLGVLVAAVVAAWSLGRFRRLRQDYVRSLAERARQAEADRALRAEQAADRERTRIAREMHDVVSHSLAVMVAQAEAGRMAAVKDPALGIAVLPTIATTGREAMADMRSLLGVLRDDPQNLSMADAPATAASSHSAGSTHPNAVVEQEQRTPPAPQPRLRDIPALVERISATGLPVSLQESGQPRQLAATADLAAYRVVQEALTNVVKYANEAKDVEVKLLWSPSTLTISVIDDGRQRNIEHGHPAGGQGLLGMAERVSAVGGRISTGPTATGFQVVAELPVRSRVETLNLTRPT